MRAATALQFRYLFVTDASGLEVLDVTDPAEPRVVSQARMCRSPTRTRVYVARTYRLCRRRDGRASRSSTSSDPERPRIYQKFNADGQLNDARDVIVGSTNASLFAYVADGRNGLKVLQLTSPETQPNFYGF